jgi:hypothetical protein
MPKAVISGDIHYNLKNLELADKSTRMAIETANKLGVPFIANGDTQDQKALLRAECVNSMIETFKTASVKPYVNIGNHCKISSKGIDHALNFLKPYANVIDTPQYVQELEAYIVPYFDNIDELRSYLKTVHKGSLLIMHQGLKSAASGEYIQDHSALNTEDLKDFRTIMSHYHARQEIQCGKNVASLVGSPYTQSFGESNDLPKGYQVLYDDGSLEFVPTNLRKHVILELTANAKGCHCDKPKAIEIDDLVWVKVSGPKEFVQRIDKNYVKKNWVQEANFKLDLIPTTMTSVPVKKERNVAQLLDAVIDGLTDVTPERKIILKDLWKGL